MLHVDCYAVCMFVNNGYLTMLAAAVQEHYMYSCTAESMGYYTTLMASLVAVWLNSYAHLNKDWQSLQVPGNTSKTTLCKLNAWYEFFTILCTAAASMGAKILSLGHHP